MKRIWSAVTSATKNWRYAQGDSSKLPVVFPYEIHCQILSHLSLRELYHIRGVCRWYFDFSMKQIFNLYIRKNRLVFAMRGDSTPWVLSQPGPTILFTDRPFKDPFFTWTLKGNLLDVSGRQPIPNLISGVFGLCEGETIPIRVGCFGSRPRITLWKVVRSPKKNYWSSVRTVEWTLSRSQALPMPAKYKWWKCGRPKKDTLARVTYFHLTRSWEVIIPLYTIVLLDLFMSKKSLHLDPIQLAYMKFDPL